MLNGMGPLLFVFIYIVKRRLNFFDGLARVFFFRHIASQIGACNPAISALPADLMQSWCAGRMSEIISSTEDNNIITPALLAAYRKLTRRQKGGAGPTAAGLRFDLFGRMIISRTLRWPHSDRLLGYSAFGRKT
jgi:hypothetical protein